MTERPKDRPRGFGRYLRPIADLAGIALLALMTITVVDVVGRWIGVLYLRGVIELSNTTLIFLAFLALPYSFVVGGHLLIEIATRNLPARVNRMIDAFWLAATGIFLGFVAWWTGKAAIELFELGEISLDLELPLYIFWMPAVFGLALSAITALVMAVRTFRRGE